MSELERAVLLLKEGDYTCVILSGSSVYTSQRRGVAPLLELLDSAADVRGHSAADRVVGKAAAMLYVLLGVAEVHAGVISEAARAVFQRADIPCFYDELVPAIYNRTKTGFCPMESAVRDIDEPLLAPELVRARLRELNANN